MLVLNPSFKGNFNISPVFQHSPEFVQTSSFSAVKLLDHLDLVNFAFVVHRKFLKFSYCLRYYSETKFKFTSVKLLVIAALA